MLHPLALGAVALLALNDRILKAAYPSWWTGKLSDFAGLLFFPWFLVSVWELAAWLLGRRWRAGPRILGVAIGLTLVVFTSLQISPALGVFYEHAVSAFWEHFPPAYRSWLRLGTVRHTADPTDLVALPMLWLCWSVSPLRGHC